MTAPANRESQPDARARILAATRSLVARGGAAEVSIGNVAKGAHVSKALIHYHFRDKDSLLLALIEEVGHVVLTRAREANRSDADAHVLDQHWEWLERELATGDLRILLALAETGHDRVRMAARRIADERRSVAAGQVGHIFARLGLTSRVPPELMAETVVAFTDGLAACHGLDSERNPRPAFDVLWLALLTLAE